MANIKIKDRKGKEQVFAGVEKIMIPDSDGKMATFAEGTSANLQDSKSYSISENGNTEVLPDDGYDGMKKVIVDVDVPQEDHYQNGYETGYAEGVASVALEEVHTEEYKISAGNIEHFSIDPESGYSGMKSVALSVEVEKPYLTGKTFTKQSDGSWRCYSEGLNAMVQMQLGFLSAYFLIVGFKAGTQLAPYEYVFSPLSAMDQAKYVFISELTIMLDEETENETPYMVLSKENADALCESMKEAYKNVSGMTVESIEITDIILEQAVID